MSCLPKPVLRGHVQKAGLKAIVGGLVFGSLCAGAYYMFVSIPHKRKYEQFLSTYDPEVHLKELISAGLLQNYKRK